MPPKKKTQPAPEAPKRTRAPRRSPRDLAHDLAAKTRDALALIHRSMDSVGELRTQVAALVDQLDDATGKIAAFPAEIGTRAKGPVGRKFALEPEARGRYRGLAEPVTVVEEYRDGKLRMAVVEDAKGARVPGVLMAHLRAYLEPVVTAPTDSTTGAP